MGKSAINENNDKLDEDLIFDYDYDTTPSHFLKEIYNLVGQVVHAKQSLDSEKQILLAAKYRVNNLDFSNQTNLKLCQKTP